MRIELATSSLPRKCSTTELQRHTQLFGFIIHILNVKVQTPFSERETGLEPATYSLEGYRSTK